MLKAAAASAFGSQRRGAAGLRLKPSAIAANAKVINGNGVAKIGASG